MYSSIHALELSNDAAMNGKHLALTDLNDRDLVGSNALRDMIGGPESLQYVEYDCMAVKLNGASQVTICCRLHSHISRARYNYPGLIAAEGGASCGVVHILLQWPAS